MCGSADYEIPYTGLGLGKHAFRFELDGAFFKEFEPSGLVEANICAETELDRFDEMMHFDVRVTGTVKTACDRCDAPMSVPVDHHTRYVIKFGASTHKTDDDILVLGPAEHLLDAREFLYESTILAMPLRQVHENIEDCDQEVVRWLTGSVDDAPSEVHKEEIDPRWAALKGLGSDQDEKRD